ncbi:MAG: S8 family serine peptidase [Deltaproteobacteria bacterium]|nr:S8 family serine peptidase [Deltaproteobacteria bacterium]
MQVDLGAKLNGQDVIEVWARERRVDRRGRAQEEVRATDDRELLAALEAITQEGFADPTVQVLAEDYSYGDEDGTSVTGTRVRLERRVPENEADVTRKVEDATGMLFDEWVRSRPPRPVAPERTKEDRVDQVRARALEAGESEVTVFLRVAGEPATQVPRFPSSPVDLSPLELSDLRLARLEAMTARGEEILTLQDGFVRWLEENGGVATVRHWLDNSLVARVPADLLGELGAREDVTWVQGTGLRPLSPSLDQQAIRADAGGIQVAHYWGVWAPPWGDYYGQTISSRNDHGIYVGIVEASRGLSTNHEGLDDWSWGDSRVESTWDCRTPPCEAGLPACATPPPPPHGMAVASILLSDYLDGQHPQVTGTERWKRTGIAREASASFILLDSEADTHEAAEVAMQEGVDIVNYSTASEWDCETDPLLEQVDAVNDAYFDGILWIAAQGNQEVSCYDPTCNTSSEAAAFGSVSVAGLDAAAENGSIDDNFACWLTSSDGRAYWGAVADLAAPSAAYRPMDCADDFEATRDSCAGTSYSAPHVAGGSALLMEHWIETFSDAHAHQPGRMHSVLLMMADGCGANDEIDGRWGAGRFKMRRFDAAGLDAPYRAVSASFTATAADPGQSWNLYTDANGNLANMPSDADAIVATAFCRLNNASTFEGLISLRLENELGQEITSVLQSGEKTKLTWNPGYQKYVLEAEILFMPAGSSIPCYVMWAWEDSDRDDANGPNPDVDPWPVGTDPSAPSCDSC